MLRSAFRSEIFCREMANGNEHGDLMATLRISWGVEYKKTEENELSKKKLQFQEILRFSMGIKRNFMLRKKNCEGRKKSSGKS